MLVHVASIALTALAFSCVTGLLLSSTADAARRRRIGWWVAAWFVGVSALAAAGVFAASGLGTPGIGAVVAVPLVVWLIAFARSSSVRAVVEGIPLSWMVGIHGGRLLGVFFVALYASGELPPTFALTAGLGDILVALTAVPIAWMVHRNTAGWPSLALLWNGVGFLDLTVAVALGVGSAADSPWRFVFEAPASGIMGTLPWLLIPGFLVPLYLLSHLAIFARLARRARAGAAVTSHGAA